MPLHPPIPSSQGCSGAATLTEAKGEERGRFGGVGEHQGGAPRAPTDPSPPSLQLAAPGGSHGTEKAGLEGTANERPVGSWGGSSSPCSAGRGSCTHPAGPGAEPRAFPPQVGDAEGQQSFHSELHVAASPQGGPPEVPKKSERVLQMGRVLNPDNLAPGERSHPKADPAGIHRDPREPSPQLWPWEEAM